MNVVFHVSSGSVFDVRHATNNVRNLIDDESVETDSITVLANGDAVYSFLETSPIEDRVGSLVDDGVRCRVCRNALRARGVDEDALVDGVEVVPSGVGELVRRQAAGDAYLKVP
jgi:intracellular sulfur oxidation DsrE/DsrF family protein